MIRNFVELKKVLMDKYKFQEITIKEFEEKYPHYSLDGDKSPNLKYLKGIFVDISGKVNMSNDPFVIIVFAKDNNKVIGQRLNGGEDVVPDGLFNTLDEIEYDDFEDNWCIIVWAKVVNDLIEPFLRLVNFSKR